MYIYIYVHMYTHRLRNSNPLLTTKYRAPRATDHILCERQTRILTKQDKHHLVYAAVCNLKSWRMSR